MLWPIYKKTFSIIKFYKAPVLSGFLIGLNYIPFLPFEFPFLPLTIFFAYVPLWLFMLKQKEMKHILIGTWICQFITTLIGFNWVAYTIHSFGNMSWTVSILGLLLFCSLSNIFMVIAGFFWFTLKKNIAFPKKIILTLILLPTLFSIFHLLTPQLFPWHLGYSWMIGLPALQTAEIWGFRFLSTLLYFFNLLFLIVYRHKWDQTGRFAVAGILTLFISLNLFGFYLKNRIPKPKEKLNVLIVQNNIGNRKNLKLSRNFHNFSDQIYSQIKHVTYSGLIGSRTKYNPSSFNIDFIVWPEGAYPYRIFKNRTQIKPLSSFVSQIETPLITGASGMNSEGYSNSIFVFDKKGNIKKPVYDKVKLVAFGEYLPFGESIPFIKKLFPYFSSRFKKGTEPQVVQLQEKNIGLQICYEGLFDFFTRRLALKKADILLNVTNDSWYGSWQEPKQHLFMSLARAIELRRPFIRATNTGHSTVIQSNGTIMNVSPLNKMWTHLYSVPYNKNTSVTLFMSWGFYINEIFLIILFLISFVYSQTRKLDKNKLFAKINSR